jgi:hypothetical protein
MTVAQELWTGSGELSADVQSLMSSIKYSATPAPPLWLDSARLRHERRPASKGAVREPVQHSQTRKAHCTSRSSGSRTGRSAHAASLQTHMRR